MKSMVASLSAFLVAMNVLAANLGKDYNAEQYHKLVEESVSRPNFPITRFLLPFQDQTYLDELNVILTLADDPTTRKGTGLARQIRLLLISNEGVHFNVMNKMISVENLLWIAHKHKVCGVSGSNLQYFADKDLDQDSPSSGFIRVFKLNDLTIYSLLTSIMENAKTLIEKSDLSDIERARLNQVITNLRTNLHLAYSQAHNSSIKIIEGMLDDKINSAKQIINNMYAKIDQLQAQIVSLENRKNLTTHKKDDLMALQAELDKLIFILRSHSESLNK